MLLRVTRVSPREQFMRKSFDRETETCQLCIYKDEIEDVGT